MTSPFLWGAGSSNNGLYQSALTLMTTELNSLASGSGVVSSAGGLSTNGVFNNTLTGQAVLGDVYFNLGGSATPTAGANIAAWFMTSPDGGTTYEDTTVALSRAPDFIIPVGVHAYTGGGQVFKSNGVHKVIVPATYFRLYVVGTLGVALPPSGNTLKLASPTINY
jgi:hypothetical protein